MIERPPHPRLSPPPRHAPLLAIKNLVTAFHTPAGRIPAVDGVSLSIERGRTLGIVGESGCGKSVTAMSVLRLVASPGRIEAGEILFSSGGTTLDLATLPEPAMRSVRGGRIGMIFQEPMTSLNPVFTVGDQIAEAVLLHRRVSREAAPAAASHPRQQQHQRHPRWHQQQCLALRCALSRQRRSPPPTQALCQQQRQRPLRAQQPLIYLHAGARTAV